MANAVVQWLGGKKFLGVDSTHHSVVLSTPAEGIGMKPSEMLLVALASCTAVDVVEILEKKRVGLRKVEIEVSAEQDPEPPWAFKKIHLKYLLDGDRLDQKSAEQAVRLSEEKYCSVAATVRGVAQISWEIELAK